MYNVCMVDRLGDNHVFACYSFSDALAFVEELRWTMMQLTDMVRNPLTVYIRIWRA